MYSWEIEKLIAQNNGIITREQFYSIVNKVDNPQVKDVKCENMFTIKTEDGYTIHTKVK